MGWQMMTQSDYMKETLDAKEKLDTVSETFCLAKWAMTSLHLTTGHTNSCYHCPQSKIDLNAPNINENAVKSHQRTQMALGARPSACSYCWNIEDTGELSDRHYRSGEAWAMEDFDKIVASQATGEIVNPRYVEVNFNHACNLKCSYCSPQFSSAWANEVKVSGAFPTTVPHNGREHFDGDRRPIPNKDNNPYVESFWRWWPELYSDLKHFRLTGGEPIMDKNTYRIFDYVLEHPKQDLHLDVTSNFSPATPGLMDEYLDYVKRICIGENVEHFMQYVSVDTWGKQAEYIRDGLDFDYMIENVDRYLTEVPYRNSLTFIMTYNNLSVVGFRKLLEHVLHLRAKHSHNYQRIWFDTPILRQPSWQAITVLPEHYQSVHLENIDWMKENLMPDDSFVGFKDYEIQKMERVLTNWKKHVNINTINMADFFLFFNEHDRRRGTNFLETFPEMKEFWEACEYRSKQQ